MYMKLNSKRLFIFIIIFCFLQGLSLCLLQGTAYAQSGSIIDSTSPYEGGYLLTTNDSVDITSTQNTGVLPDIESKEPISNNQLPQAFSSVSASETINVNGQELIMYSPKDDFEFKDPEQKNSLMKKQSLAQNTMNSLNAVQYSQGQTRTFNVVDNYYNTLYPLTATLLYSGTSCNVWVDSSNPNFTSQKALQLGQEFDNNIINFMKANFRDSYIDIDEDKKIAILCYDIKDPFYYGISNLFVGGYFFSSDLWPKADVPSATGNETDMIHIDTFPLMGNNVTNPDATLAISTIVHEFQHLLNFSDYAISYPNQPRSMEVWLNEGLSMAAEHMYANNVIQSRINYYNNSTSIANGRSLLDWDNADVLPNYSLSYLFSQYLRTQTKELPGGGNAIFKRILESNDYNYLAVENALKAYDSGMTFTTFMKNFRIALAVKDKTGVYGFAGEPGFDSVRTPEYTGTGTALKGGGAILKRISSPFNEPAGKGANISYVGITPYQAVTSISLNKSSTSLLVGQTETLAATISPLGATNKDVTWDVVNPSVTNVASVSSTGVVTANNPGTAKIRATSADNSNIYAECSLTVTSETSESDFSWDGNTITKYNGSYNTVVIPSRCTKIGDAAFNDKITLKSIIIPGNVADIGISAFNNCTGLTSVTIANGLKTIGQSSFKYCTGLTSISIPDSVTSIDQYAFEYCSGLTSIIIPDSVTNLGAGAFNGCLELTTVKLSNKITYIGSIVFNNCSKLTSIIIPSGVTSIGSFAFAGCTELNNVSIPKGVTDIFSRAFYRCGKLTSITIPDTVKRLSDYSFSSCGLTTIKIPKSVTSIEGYVFEGCSNLKSILVLDRTQVEADSLLNAYTGNVPSGCTVTGYTEITNLSLNKTSTTMKPGQTEQLTVTVTPVNATNKTVTWSIFSESVTNVVSLASDGTITANNKGTAVIRATSNSDISKYVDCNVTVTDAVGSVEGYIRLEGKGASENSGVTVKINGTSLEATTDQAGYFKIDDIFQGTITLTVSKTNYLQREVKNVAITSGQVKSISANNNPILLWAGDFDGVNGIGSSDLAVLISSYGKISGDAGYNAKADFDGINGVGPSDLNTMISHYGKTTNDYP